MSNHKKNLSLLSFVFVSLSYQLAFADSFEIPEPDTLQIHGALPKNTAELSLLRAKGAKARSCTRGEKVECECLSFQNIHIRKWTPKKIEGIFYENEGQAFFIEAYDSSTGLYSGFWNLSKRGWRANAFDGSLDKMEFGEISKPDYCSKELPKIKKEASASKATWSRAQQSWHLEKFQKLNALAYRDYSEKQESGFLAPTLYLSEENFEAQAGFYIPQIRSQVLGSISTKRAGLGLGIITTRPYTESLSQLELGTRLRFDDAKVLPFLVGDIFIGAPRVHVSGRFDIDEGLTRPLIGRQLFKARQESRVGVLLSGDKHHLRFGAVETRLDSKEQSISGEYSSRFLLRETALDIGLRYDASELESQTPLQSTTLSVRLHHRFGHPGLYLEPSLQLTNNFSTIPIDKGFDASTTGYTLGQLSGGMRLIGHFENLTHIVGLEAFGGRDLFGFQQRSIRDGGSPFSFRRQAGLTYAWGGLENLLLGNAWNIGLPAGVLVENIGEEWSTTPILAFRFGAKDLRLSVESICEDDCKSARFKASTSVDIGNLNWGEEKVGLSIQYSFSDYGDDDYLRSALRDSTHRSFNLPFLDAENINRFFHVAHLKASFPNYELGLEGYLANEFEGILAHLRLGKSLGWSIDSRSGWSSERGFSAQLGLSANSRFFNR